jgi:thymidylate kinase
MLNVETMYYRHIMPPDLLIVLRVEPEMAVRRKTNENEFHVRMRTREVWEVDWQNTHAHVVDAGRGIDDVIAQLHALVWARL